MSAERNTARIQVEMSVNGGKTWHKRDVLSTAPVVAYLRDRGGLYVDESIGVMYRSVAS